MNAPSGRIRPADRIDTAPRFTAVDAIRLNNLFRGSDTQTMLQGVLADGLAGDLAVVSSFGAESAVLLHLVGTINPAVPVLFLDTGKHFPETIAYRDELVARLGLRDVRVLSPELEELAERDGNGLRWSFDPDGCCDIRKTRPLTRALAGFDASFTGRKAFQAATRAHLPRFELDSSDALGRLKINPLIDWSASQIAGYFILHDLPQHPLIGRGYPSIGCSPCTRPVAPGEDARSGRWAGWDKVECGIHQPGDVPGERPDGYEPFL